MKVMYNKEKQKVPVKVWTNSLLDVEPQALQQLENVATMPFIHKHVAAMPDVHVEVDVLIDLGVQIEVCKTASRRTCY